MDILKSIIIVIDVTDRLLGWSQTLEAEERYSIRA